MAIPTYPGVYVEEVSSGVRPITIASTSTAAFIGEAEKGSLDEAVKIYNFTEFQNLYGGFLPGGPYLAHAVYQFFINGGSQCYIIRVAGDGNQKARIGLSDRAVDAQLSLTIKATSPGAWGNRIEVVVSDGTRDAGNEFKIQVFYEGEDVPRETYDNLSMVRGASNFVAIATGKSKLIQATVNQENNNASNGKSQGGALAQTVQLIGEKTRLRINVNNDGYQEINLQEAVDADQGPVTDLNTAENVRAAIQYTVRRLGLTRQRGTTDPAAFSGFTCTLNTVDTNKIALLLTSGTVGFASSVVVAPAAKSAQDATGLLKLGLLQQGTVETLGSSVTRPANNSTAVPRYLVGVPAPSTDGIFPGSIVPGHDGSAMTQDQGFIKAFNLLDKVNDVSLLAVPGRGSKDLVGAGMNYCATRPLSDIFFIGDMTQDDDTVPELQTFVGGISPKNSYGAVYAPWLFMLDPTGQSKEPIAVPPSGFVAGMYAKTDTQRGVWKAPAGTAAALAGATGLGGCPRIPTNS